MLEQEDILKDLKSLVPDNIIKVNEPLKRYTYTKTGGNADFYLSPIENEQVQTIVRYAQEHQLPVTYLGNGSNIIIREGGI
ncbi:FAD-binding protein, partial [Staphylococcus epidermidis]